MSSHSALTESIWEEIDHEYVRTDANPYDIIFRNETHCWTISQNKSGLGHGIILHTKDSGSSWTLQLYNESMQFKHIEIIGNDLWVSAYGGLFHSSNDGLTWNYVFFGIELEIFYGIYFYNESLGWTGSERGFYKTMDGGNTWNQTPASPYNGRARDIYFVTPEEGWVSGTVVGLKRYHVLRPGPIKADTYRELFGIKPLVTEEHVDFILRHGYDVNEHLSYEKGDVVGIKINQIKKLARSANPSESRIAREFYQIIFRNQNNLVHNEVQDIFKQLGVMMTPKVDSVLFYKESKRVSVRTVATTSGIDDAIRLLLIAPPNHPRKMNSAVEIVLSRKERVNQIKAQIEKDGLKIHSDWEVYGI